MRTIYEEHVEDAPVSAPAQFVLLDSAINRHIAEREAYYMGHWHTLLDEVCGRELGPGDVRKRGVVQRMATQIHQRGWDLADRHRPCSPNRGERHDYRGAESASSTFSLDGYRLSVSRYAETDLNEAFRFALAFAAQQLRRFYDVDNEVIRKAYFAPSVTGECIFSNDNVEWRGQFRAHIFGFYPAINTGTNI